MGYRIDIDHANCINCGVCMDVCPVQALDMSRPDQPGNTQTAAQFINRIDIPSTRAYVVSIMQRYRQVKNSRK